ncbi:hypothetical protein PV327_007644 [Microctonus hyperodae]|uniref:Ferritin n=1 Tax=Microctonus hyperodae TaxID=165561 RepID=A0AA39KYP4_MICHY|nr:hypothetical protein PV327_007644 [Microctonus hyperodae]
MMMKLGVLLGILLVSSYATAEFCYNDVEAACGSSEADGVLLANCDAKYGGIDALVTDLQAYANALIETSFDYLLMTAHFGNFEAYRPGFHALYLSLSDKAWENGIKTIQFITKRGGKMNFNQPPRLKRNTKERHLELNELHSLAKALDTEKKLAEEALRIHTQAQHHTKQDSSVAHHIEEEFFKDQSERVRDLAGYTTILKSLLVDRDPSISLTLFDDYLKSVY